MNTYLRDVLISAGIVEARASWATGFFVGAGVGVLAGAVAAALLTPTSGTEMRSQLGTKAKEIKDRAQKAISEAGERTQQALSEASERVSNLTADALHARNNVVPMS
jgi:gas vesicle protein